MWLSTSLRVYVSELDRQQTLIPISDVLFVPQSVASDMRFELFPQNDIKQNSKRQRVINSRYREDYIEPVVYRAIMEWCPLPSPTAFQTLGLTRENNISCSGFCFWLLLIATTTLLHLLLSQPFRLHIYELRLGLDTKCILCVLNNIHRPLFAITLCKLFSSFIIFSPLFSGRSHQWIIKYRNAGVSDCDKMFSFFLYHAFSSYIAHYTMYS